MLRFELELALIEGSLDVADLPAAWNDGMRRLLGVEVPDDARGVLQDMHWAARRVRLLPELRARLPHRGAAVGALEADAGAQDDALRRRRRGGDPGVAGRARAPLRPAARHGAARRARDRRRDRSGPFLRHASAA